MFWWRPGLAPRNRRWARLAGSLMELGHWSHLPPERAREEMRAVARGEYPFAGPAFEGLEFFADGEDLAEGGVEEMLGEMEPALRRHGVQLRVETVRRSGLVDACNLPELPVDAPPAVATGPAARMTARAVAWRRSASTTHRCAACRCRTRPVASTASTIRPVTRPSVGGAEPPSRARRA